MDSVDVLIRVDASLRMGTGHVFRSLVVAGWLRDRGYTVAFASRRLPGNLIDRIRAHDFPVAELEIAGPRTNTWLEVEIDVELRTMRGLIESLRRKPRWIVVDHYALDATWERSVSSMGPRVFVVDDLTNRPHDVDVLLDNIVGPADRYDRLVPARTRRFLGPRYAPVRDDFITERLRARARDGSIRRVLVFYGGVDYTGETPKALRALRAVPGDLQIDVIVGATNPLRSEIVEEVSNDPRARIRLGDGEMAALTAAADVVLGSIGSAMWERCFVGVPSITTTTLDFLEQIGERIAETGASISLGVSTVVTQRAITETLIALQCNPERVVALGKAAFDLCAGYDEARHEIIGVFAG